MTTEKPDTETSFLQPIKKNILYNKSKVTAKTFTKH